MIYYQKKKKSKTDREIPVAVSKNKMASQEDTSRSTLPIFNSRAEEEHIAPPPMRVHRPQTSKHQATNRKKSFISR